MQKQCAFCVTHDNDPTTLPCAFHQQHLEPAYFEAALNEFLPRADEVEFMQRREQSFAAPLVQSTGAHFMEPLTRAVNWILQRLRLVGPCRKAGM